VHGVVLENEGVRYAVAYVIRDGGNTYALVRRIRRRRKSWADEGRGERRVPTSHDPSALLHSLYAAVPEEHPSLLESQLRRLLDLYRGAPK